MKINYKKIILGKLYYIPIFVFVSLIATFGIFSLKDMLKVRDLNIKGSHNLRHVSFTVEKQRIQNIIFQKYSMINLAGLITKILGMNNLNNIQKFKSGHLGQFELKTKDTAEFAKKVGILNKYLKRKSILFLYVLSPSKNSMYDVQFSPGYKDNSADNISSIISQLRDNNVNFLNMNDILREFGWKMENTFPKTDNHWFPEAQLFAAKKIMENFHIQTNLNLEELDKLEESAYEKHILKQGYFGAWGRRTGIYYTGLDDFTVFIPKFPYDIQFSSYSSQNKTWTEADTLLKERPTQIPPFFVDEAYNIYMPGAEAIQIIKNKNAKLKKKILVFGDSFSRIVKYFLAFQFEELHFIHLQKYNEGSLLQYILENDFDFAVMVTNEGQLSDQRYYTYGLEDYSNYLGKSFSTLPMASLHHIELSSESNRDKFMDVPIVLQPGLTYTLKIGDTRLIGSEGKFIQLELHNLSRNEPVSNRFIWANSTKEQKWIFKVPNNQNDTFSLFLYAGLKGKTEGNKINISQLALYNGY